MVNGSVSIVNAHDNFDKRSKLSHGFTQYGKDPFKTRTLGPVKQAACPQHINTGHGFLEHQ